MKKLLIISMFTFLFMCLTSFASAQWVTTQLTTNSDYDFYPQINASGHVVWQGVGGSDGGTDLEIFYYDGNTVSQLTNNATDDAEPMINASGHIVWHGEGGSDGGADDEIFYYDGNTVTQLTNNSNDDRGPQINTSGHVVWSCMIGYSYMTDYEIFYYDGNTVTQLTNNTYSDRSPKINDIGHVVWHGYYYDEDKEIFYYDGNTVTQLTNDIVAGEFPQINESGHVVWQGSDDDHHGIFYYDGRTVTPLTFSKGFRPQINDSGHVVWYGSAGYEIFYYDGTTVVQLTNNSYVDSYPEINASGHIVWHGKGGSDGGADDEIFYYDGNTVTQLTNNVIDDGSPQINDSGHVVWEGGYKIFIAEFSEDVDSDGVGYLIDNCPYTFNPRQEDADEDGIGDVCDAVTVYDRCRIEWRSSPGEVSSVPTSETSRTEQATYEAFLAIYPNFANPVCHPEPWNEFPWQECYSFTCESSDEWSYYFRVCIAGFYESLPFGSYGTWDVVCDSDGDGIDDTEDNCPGFCNVEQLDADEDTIGDVCDESPGCGGCGEDACELSCDIDTDGDGIVNVRDNCPNDANSDQLDTDNDTIGNVCDACTNNDSTVPEIVYGPVRITTDGQIYPEDIYGCTYDCAFSRDTAADGFTPVRTGYVPLSFRINDDMLETASEYVPAVSYIFTECDEDGTALPGTLPVIEGGIISVSADSNGDFTSYVYRLQDDIDGDGESDLYKYYQFKFTVTDCAGQISESPADNGVYYIQLVPELP